MLRLLKVLAVIVVAVVSVVAVLVDGEEPQRAATTLVTPPAVHPPAATADQRSDDDDDGFLAAPAAASRVPVVGPAPKMEPAPLPLDDSTLLEMALMEAAVLERVGEFVSSPPWWAAPVVDAAVTARAKQKTRSDIRQYSQSVGRAFALTPEARNTLADAWIAETEEDDQADLVRIAPGDTDGPERSRATHAEIRARYAEQFLTVLNPRQLAEFDRSRGYREGVQPEPVSSP